MGGGPVAHTRSELLVRRRRLSVTREGLEILQSKLNVLMGELLGALMELDEVRRELAVVAEQAGVRLSTALALDGEAAVRSVGLGARRSVEFAVETRRVMGVAAPHLVVPSLRRGPTGRGHSIVGVSARIVEAAESFERLLELLLASAAIETRVARLGAEATRTRRRRNALDYQIIPRLEREAAEIERALEERAREDLFRLKLGKRGARGRRKDDW